MQSSKPSSSTIVDELGFDDCINYRTASDMEAAIRTACPEGVDFYFDNVGGEILDAALLNMNKDSTLLFCGTISTYNATEPVPGPGNGFCGVVGADRAAEQQRGVFVHVE